MFNTQSIILDFVVVLGIGIKFGFHGDAEAQFGEFFEYINYEYGVHYEIIFTIVIPVDCTRNNSTG